MRCVSGMSALAVAFLISAGRAVAAPAGPDTLVALTAPAIEPNLTMPIVNDSGAFASGPIILGTNTAAGYGLEGIADGAGVGVYGIAESPNGGYGFYGYAKGIGRGAAGVSAKGDGLLGSALTSGRGVYGVSAQGNGVEGTSSGHGAGVVGASGSGDGVVGSSGNGDLVYGVVGTEASYYEQGGNAGVQGLDNSNTTCGSSCLNFGVYGISNNNGYGVYGSGPGTGVGVYGDTGTGTAVEAQGGRGTALHLYGSGSYLIIATGAGNASDVMTLDDSGNLDLAGTVTQNGTPAVSSPGRGAQIESIGDGRIEAGTGYVALDPAFAKHLDPAYSYHVFLTPNGDSDGLYVASKSSSGFTVRENRRSKGTLAFDYRVIGTAKRVAPRRSAAVRMPSRKALVR